MTISEMSEKVDISERSVYKNLSLINEKLKSLNIEGIRNVYGQGYYLGENSKRELMLYQSKLEQSKYSSTERQYLEFIELFINGKFSIQKVSERCGVSKQTVLKDIDSLKQKMNDYEITIISNYDGHFLSGSEIQIRQFLFSWLYSNQELANLYETKEIKELRFLISQWLDSLENSKNIIYSDEFIYVFEHFYALTLERIFNGNSTAKKFNYPLNSKLQ